MKKIRLFVAALFVLICGVFGFAACKKDGEAKVSLLLETDTRVVIRVNQVEGDAVLIAALEDLQEKGELTFTVSGGMIIAINDVENGANYNPCWMIYTSDSEMASTEYGTVEYDGQTLGSAILGVEELPLIEGGIYIFEYQTF